MLQPKPSPKFPWPPLLRRWTCGMLSLMNGPRALGLQRQITRHTIATGFALSLVLHFCIFAVVELGHSFGFWRPSIIETLQRLNSDSLRLAQKEPPRQTTTPSEPPLLFIEVDPSQATEEEPDQAKFYSARNAKAGNPNPDQDREVPKIDGNQDKVPRTIDVLRPQPAPKPEPLRPSPPLPEPEPRNEEIAQKEPPAEPAPTPAPPQPSGDLAVARPSETAIQPREPAEPAEKPQPPRRYRRVAEALQAKNGIIGPKMKQDGGVRRPSIEAGFDVRATPFGAYDAAIIAAIQKRWYDLLDERDFSRGYSGKVVLTFRLNVDGRVSDMNVEHNEVSEILALLCQRAVEDPAPYASWPSDLRRLVGADYREVRFTFHYN